MQNYYDLPPTRYHACLQQVKGSGKFISIHSADFIFPGLEVKGVGEISFPLIEAQAKALIKVAERAPFGHGSKTLLDETVRNTWEIDEALLAFNNPRWADFLVNVIKSIKPGLGLEGYTIAAHLYKMLIYEKGSFFLTHKDSEKEKGMFGTLVIELPCHYTGGELVVSFEGKEEIVNFAKNFSDYKINYAAFYADCDHEVKPITSGLRLCLVYNLIQQKAGNKIQLQSLETVAGKLTGIFTTHQQQGYHKPYIVLLGHQYTPENFSANGLKLNDRAKAEALLLAAKKAGCYAKMCLVTSYISGVPECGGYGYGEDADPDEPIGEIIEESQYIEHWLENDVPAFSNVAFEEEELIASFALKDDEPIIKESTGYMGNYGPDLMHWYHYGAVMIWSPEANAALLEVQDTASILKWIEYFNKRAHAAADSEISALSKILVAGLKNERFGEKENYNAIAEWVINRKDETFFLQLEEHVLQSYFTCISTDGWVKLIGFLPADVTNKIFARVTERVNLPVIEQLLHVLRQLIATGKGKGLVAALVKDIPAYLSALPTGTAEKQVPATPMALKNLFWIELQLPQDTVWIEKVAEAITRCKERNYIIHVLLPALLPLTKKTELAAKMLVACQHFLQQRVNDKPQPPANWSRPVPKTLHQAKQWLILKTFLESPDEQVFEYRKNQNERHELEHAINSVEIDLITETIKKGSPHTLRITKTKAAYNKQMKIWNEDLELLDKIIQKTVQW